MRHSHWYTRNGAFTVPLTANRTEAVAVAARILNGTTSPLAARRAHFRECVKRTEACAKTDPGCDRAMQALAIADAQVKARLPPLAQAHNVAAKALLASPAGIHKGVLLTEAGEQVRGSFRLIG